MTKHHTRIAISGGGTGGHVFPALAIAQALQHREPNVELLFVGALGKMEMERVPAAGYKIIGLDIQGLQRSFSISNLLFPVKVYKSVMQSYEIIKDFKPDVVVGVGGYASGPLLYAANKKGIPTLLQEQNSYPGITNKLLAKGAMRICVAYEGMDRWFPKEKIRLTGNPVRADILDIENKRKEALEFFGLSIEKKTIFVTGGSLGAKTINESVLSHIELMKGEDVQLIWQCGKYYYNSLKESFKEADYPNVKLLAFVSRVDLAYSVADLIIARAGASTISELCLVRKAAILVPSPNVAEDHQTKNAMALVNKGAALLLKDDAARADLMPLAMDLLGNEEKRRSLTNNISSMGLSNAADDIAFEVLKLCR